jgi:hypothetical protein
MQCIHAQAYLQVFVEDASHGREGALVSLMFNEPGLCSTQLLRVNKDEAPRLGKGLQHKRCQPEAGKTWIEGERGRDRRGEGERKR